MAARIKALHAGILLAGAGLVTSGAFGLELGDITLSSALNEPLAASIELESLSGTDASAIRVTVGDQAAYDQIDIERTPFLDSIRFTVEVDDEDEGRIVVTSTQAINEPFLNLIVSVAEPGGVTQQEYTLLLDLPAERAVARATPPVASQRNTPASANNAASATSGTYTVAPGDTLWEIAQNTRPNTDVSVERMMLAIQRTNGDAFIGGNINRLISGRVLRLPEQQDIEVIDQRSALAQISQQNSTLGGQPLAAGGNSAGGSAADSRDQLSVLSGDTAAADGGSSDLAATIIALENELMLSEENLDRARIENLEANNRLSSLQEQIDLLENIIAIEDERIAQLQAELSEQAAATAQALASANSSVTALEDINDEAPSGLTGLLRNTVVLLGVLVALALAVLGFLVYRRRQAQLVAEESTFNPALDSDDEPGYDEVETPGLLAGLLGRFRRKQDDDDDNDFDDFEDDITDAQPAPPVSAAPQPRTVATAPVRDNADLDDDLLDDALDGIDAPDSDDRMEEAFTPIDEATPESTEAEQDESAQLSEDSDYALTAATAAFAAIDEVADDEELIEFSATPDSVETTEAPLEPVADIEAPETFEFTLQDLPEVESAAPAAAEEVIETFDFNISKPAEAQPEPAAAAESAVAASEKVEVIAFPSTAAAAPATPAPAAHPAAPEDELALELGDLSFDDTMLTDDNDEDSQYKPRTGNECDTKLDLATAYEAMGDVAEAIEILDEVIAEGSPSQVETAQRLKEAWQASL